MKRRVDLSCEQVRFYAETFAAEQLDDDTVATVRRHLNECTDCRVQHQRTQRVIGLVQLKRYEQPPPGYFDNFLTEFHRRQLAAERSGWRGVRARLAEPMTWSLAWKWAASGACGALVIAAVMWFGWTSQQAALTAIPFAPADVQQERFGRHTPVAASQPTSPIELTVAWEPPTGDADATYALALTPDVPVRAVPTAPRYVLDRIPVTTVRFEPRADF